MAEAIVVLNAGSSSLKFSLFARRDGGAVEPVVRGNVEGLYTAPRFVGKDPSGDAARGAFLGRRREARSRWGARTRSGISTSAASPSIGYVAWVTVSCMAGSTTHSPFASMPRSWQTSEQLIPLAPLHQAHNLAPIRALLERSPPLPQVACFDTAFHSGAPAVARAFALPKAITERGVRRYGFHGLSYEHIANVLAATSTLAPRVAEPSCCTLVTARACVQSTTVSSVATTMGFTAADGLPMGTRCGSLDPGVMLYLLDELKMDARAIEKLIYQESGLLGVSGISSDMRTLEASRGARRARCDRPLHLSDPPRAGFARCCARWRGCHRVHGGHWGEQYRFAGARVPRRTVARHRARRRRQRGGRAAH